MVNGVTANRLNGKWLNGLAPNLYFFPFTFLDSKIFCIFATGNIVNQE
jgi:hypothetical protein